MSQGWIKIHRQIQDCDIWDTEEPFDYRSAWIDLLLLVNHKDKKTVFDGKSITVKKGQRITSVRKLSERWHWSVNRTYRYLRLLEDLGMIQKESDNRRTLLTIVKYEDFQDTENTHEYTDRTLIEHSRNTNKNEKNDKNEKNIKKEVKKEIFGEFKNVKLTLSEYDRLGDEFGTDKRDKAIRYLDEYIEDKGYKSKSHNLAIRRWVFKALDEHKPKNNFMKAEISHDEIENLYAN